MDKHDFQYCQKIVVLSKDKSKVLLAKRQSEEDYDSTFSFIGGKMQTSDKSIIEGLKREKDEELGINFKINLYKTFSTNVLFQKANGKSMILPHYLAIEEEGEITLNEEYSTYKWIHINELNEFEPKIPNIPETVKQLLRLQQIATKEEFVTI